MKFFNSKDYRTCKFVKSLFHHTYLTISNLFVQIILQFFIKRICLFPIMCVQCLVIPIQYPYVIVRHISLYQRNETFAYLLFDNYLYMLYRIKGNNSENSCLRLTDY